SPVAGRRTGLQQQHGGTVPVASVVAVEASAALSEEAVTEEAVPVRATGACVGGGDGPPLARRRRPRRPEEEEEEGRRERRRGPPCRPGRGRGGLPARRPPDLRRRRGAPAASRLAPSSLPPISQRLLLLWLFGRCRLLGVPTKDTEPVRLRAYSFSVKGSEGPRQPKASKHLTVHRREGKCKGRRRDRREAPRRSPAGMSEPTEAAATACAAGGSKSEEEALLEAIAEQRRLVDAMPSDTLTDICERAPHEKKLGQLEFRHHLPLEKYRISSVLATFEEEHGSLYKEPCLLCLDDCYLHADLVISHRFMCCGGFTCKRCADDFRKTKPTRCPLCREPLRESSAELLLQLMVFVEKGASWAETILGRGMMYGYFGIKKQERTGLEWINKAVAKDYPAAIFELFNFRSSALTSLSSTMAHEVARCDG
ncbi:hypothetical protein THAOC_11166, partial [Thalassiosira oceanica]